MNDIALPHYDITNAFIYYVTVERNWIGAVEKDFKARPALIRRGAAQERLLRTRLCNKYRGRRRKTIICGCISDIICKCETYLEISSMHTPPLVINRY